MTNLLHWVNQSVKDEIKKYETLKKTHESSIKTINSKLQELRQMAHS